MLNDAVQAYQIGDMKYEVLLVNREGRRAACPFAISIPWVACHLAIRVVCGVPRLSNFTLAYAGSICFLSFSVLGFRGLFCVVVDVGLRGGVAFHCSLGSLGPLFSRICVSFFSFFVAHRMSCCGHKSCDFGL